MTITPMPCRRDADGTGVARGQAGPGGHRAVEGLHAGDRLRAGRQLRLVAVRGRDHAGARLAAVDGRVRLDAPHRRAGGLRAAGREPAGPPDAVADRPERCSADRGEVHRQRSGPADRREGPAQGHLPGRRTSSAGRSTCAWLCWSSSTGTCTSSRSTPSTTRAPRRTCGSWRRGCRRRSSGSTSRPTVASSRSSSGGRRPTSGRRRSPLVGSSPTSTTGRAGTGSASPSCARRTRTG
jgi:hypothetical protein